MKHREIDNEVCPNQTEHRKTPKITLTSRFTNMSSNPMTRNKTPSRGGVCFDMFRKRCFYFKTDVEISSLFPHWKTQGFHCLKFQCYVQSHSVPSYGVYAQFTGKNQSRRA